MVIVKYLCEGTGLANIPVSNIPVCLLKNVVKQVSQLFYPGKDHMIEKMKERPTQPKKKKTDGPDETQSGSTATTSEVQVEQIATEIQSADSVTSDTQQPEEPCRRRSKAAESESPNSEINVKLDTILKKLAEMTLTANKQSVAHKPGDHDKVSAVKILVQSSKSVKRISEIAKLTIDVDNNMLICDACSNDASVRLRCGAGLFNPLNVKVLN